MTDVVIRSANEQSELAGKLGGAISDAGFQVWRADGPDDDFWHSGEVVERIRSADAAVVIWSEGAATSALICDEANAARQQRKLIQVSADGRAPPAPFDGAPVAQLSGWRGESSHPGWRQIISQLEAISASGGGANAKRRISSALRLFTLPSLVLPRRLRGEAMLALPSPYTAASARKRRLEPATALLLVALTSAAGAAGWVGGRQQGIREGAERVAAAPREFGRASPVSDDARRGPASSPAAVASTASAPARVVLSRAAASAALTAPASAPAGPAAMAAPAATPAMRSEPTRPKIETAAKTSQKTARAQKPASKSKASVRSRTAPKPKPAAKPKPARPRIKYRYSETMRLFCRGAGKATPECRTFRRNAPRNRR